MTRKFLPDSKTESKNDVLTKTATNDMLEGKRRLQSENRPNSFRTTVPHKQENNDLVQCERYVPPSQVKNVKSINEPKVRNMKITEDMPEKDLLKFLNANIININKYEPITEQDQSDGQAANEEEECSSKSENIIHFQYSQLWHTANIKSKCSIQVERDQSADQELYIKMYNLLQNMERVKMLISLYTIKNISTKSSLGNVKSNSQAEDQGEECLTERSSSLQVKHNQTAHQEENNKVNNQDIRTEEWKETSNNQNTILNISIYYIKNDLITRQDKSDCQVENYGGEHATKRTDIYTLSSSDKEIKKNDNFSLSSNDQEMANRSSVAGAPNPILPPNFRFEQLKNDYVGILSVFKDKLLASWWSLSQLYVYCLKNHHFPDPIKLDDDDGLQDAIWTPNGNIVYTTWDNERVVVITERGELIKHTEMIAPRYLSISNDNIIYLADWETGIFQSTDDGITWQFVFKPNNDWHCWHVIKVITDDGYDFWTLECNDEDNYRLHQYIIKPGKDKTERDIDLSPAGDQSIYLSYSSLSYDGRTKIFLSDYLNQTVHALSINGQYDCQLVAPEEISSKPSKLAVDENKRLFVGQQNGYVGAFDLMKSKMGSKKQSNEN